MSCIGVVHLIFPCFDSVFGNQFGTTVKQPILAFGDNFGVIQNATIPELELKKKHLAIFYHSVREVFAVRIIQAAWIRTHANFSDV